MNGATKYKWFKSKPSNGTSINTSHKLIRNICPSTKLYNTCDTNGNTNSSMCSPISLGKTTSVSNNVTSSSNLGTDSNCPTNSSYKLVNKSCYKLVRKTINPDSKAVTENSTSKLHSNRFSLSRKIVHNSSLQKGTSSISLSTLKSSNAYQTQPKSGAQVSNYKIVRRPIIENSSVSNHSDVLSNSTGIALSSNRLPYPTITSNYKLVRNSGTTTTARQKISYNNLNKFSYNGDFCKTTSSFSSSRFKLNKTLPQQTTKNLIFFKHSTHILCRFKKDYQNKLQTSFSGANKYKLIRISPKKRILHLTQHKLDRRSPSSRLAASRKIAHLKSLELPRHVLPLLQPVKHDYYRSSVLKAKNKLRFFRKPVCLFFVKTGTCRAGDKCHFTHDKQQVRICSKFLKGNCPLTNESCPLSHQLDSRKLPICSFYERGVCVRPGCPYLHVKFAPDTPVCLIFQKGMCPKGLKCDKRHVWKSQKEHVRQKNTSTCVQSIEISQSFNSSPHDESEVILPTNSDLLNCTDCESVTCFESDVENDLSQEKSNAANLREGGRVSFVRLPSDDSDLFTDYL